MVMVMSGELWVAVIRFSSCAPNSQSLAHAWTFTNTVAPSIRACSGMGMGMGMGMRMQPGMSQQGMHPGMGMGVQQGYQQQPMGVQQGYPQQGYPQQGYETSPFNY